METLQWLLSEIARSLEDFSSARLTYGLLFAVSGLAIGAVLAFVAGRSGAFQRADNGRTKMARLNYGYIPLIFMVFGGWFGVIYGTHTAADQFVDERAKPLTQYGQTYLTQVMALVPEMEWDQYRGQTLAEAFANKVNQKLGNVDGSPAQPYFSVINQAVINQALKESGVSNLTGEASAVLNEYKNHRLPGNAFIGLPRMIHQELGNHFSGRYGLVLWVFLGFLLLPVVEYLAFRFSGKQPQPYQPAQWNPKPVVVAAPSPPDVVVVPEVARKEAEPSLPEIKVASEDMKVATIAPVAPPVVETPPEPPVAIPETILPPPVEMPPPVQETPPPPPAVAESIVEPEAPEPVAEPELVAPPVWEKPPVFTPPPPAPPRPEPIQANTASNSSTENLTPEDMRLILSSTAVTYILGGALLQLYGGIGSGWLSVFIAIFGFIIFYVGLEKLKSGLDSTGQSAVAMLKLAAIIGAISAVIDLIPLVGFIASLGYMVAYVIELVGYLKLKNSKSIGIEGSSGATYLFIAMILAVVQSIFGLLPFVGGFIAGPIGFVALLLVFFGWIKIQEGMVRGN